MKTKIFLIRHGESEQNAEDVLSGVTDVPLSSKGKSQCVLLSRFFKNKPVDRVFASPLQRAQESAGLIFPRHAPNILVKDSLIEFNYGKYEGFNRASYNSDLDEIINQWLAAPSNLSFPGGGNIQEHANDSYLGLLEIASQNQGKAIACISHRTTIRLIVAKTIGLHLDKFRFVPCSNCGITEFSFDGELKLISLNVTPQYVSASWISTEQ